MTGADRWMDREERKVKTDITIKINKAEKIGLSLGTAQMKKGPVRF